MTQFPVSRPVPVVWSSDTRSHEPHHEVWIGVPTGGTEVAARVDAILDRLRADGHRLVAVEPADSGRRDAALASVHGADLLEFLRTAAGRWAAGPGEELVGQDRVVPYLVPAVAMTAGLPTRPAAAVHDDAGRFVYDTMTLIGPGTWEAATAAVDCALVAVDLVVGEAPMAYALRRPP